MEVTYLKSFSKDLDKIKDQKLKDKLSLLINDLKDADNLTEIKHVKNCKDSILHLELELGIIDLAFLKNQIMRQLNW